MDKGPHAWVKSQLGHGERYCTQCHATNREIAVIGDMNVCTKAPEPAPADRMDLAGQLDALSEWMQAENLDMQCPEGVQDPSILAAAHRALLAEHKATLERVADAGQSTIDLMDLLAASDTRAQAAEAELSATKQRLAEVERERDAWKADAKHYMISQGGAEAKLARAKEGLEGLARLQEDWVKPQHISLARQIIENAEFIARSTLQELEA